LSEAGENIPPNELPPSELADLSSWLLRQISRETIFSGAPSLVSTVLGLGALYTASGFVIVNLYLIYFTDGFRYNIAIGQYLAAGVGLWFSILTIWGTIFYFWYKAARRNALNAGELEIVRDARKWLEEYLKDLTRQRDEFEAAAAAEKLDPNDVEKQSSRMYARRGFQQPLSRGGGRLKELKLQEKALRSPYGAFWVFLVGVVLAVLITAPVYGLLVYPRFPRFLGGVYPLNSVQLILKPDLPPSILGVSSSSSTPWHSPTVEILAELSDGLLVFDPTTGATVAIKSDQIIAVLDDEPATDRIVQTSIAPATDMVTQEATSEATSEATAISAP
jgi:hypothetical protein